jgi:ligand-binding sensor protein
MTEKPEKSYDNITLKDIIDIEEWQKIQDNFSTVTGVSLRTVDAEGEPITHPSRITKLCSELLKDPYIQEQICGTCLPTFLGGKAIVDRNLSFFCQAGLCNFVAPLRYESGNVLGYLVVGPVVLVTRGPKEQYLDTASELNISLDDFWSTFLEIKVISFQGVKSLIELIKELSEYTIRLAYENKLRVQRASMEPDLSKVRKILDSLLDVAFEISKADVGSLMMLDPRQENLTIKSSKGIPEEIANRAKVRLGEGIAGVAAKQGKAYLIDDALDDNRIRPYLSRPYLGSSMVIPLKVEERLLGVMNLGALKTSTVQFNPDSLQLMNKLIGLVTTAITPSD